MLAGWSSAWKGLAAAGIFWSLWVANFNDLEFGGADPERPYSFPRHLFGEPTQPELARAWGVDEPVAYQFGLALPWSLFYAIGKLSRQQAWRRSGDTQRASRPSRSRSAPSSLSPAFCSCRYCAGSDSATGLRPSLGCSERPSSTTAVSRPACRTSPTLVLTLLVALLARYFRSPLPSRWLPVAMGVVVGYAATVRYFNAFFAAALVIGFACYRQLRPAARSPRSTGTFGLPAAIPLLVGVDNLTSGYAEDSSGAVSSTFGFSPETLIRMLFSDRGLFVWTWSRCSV